MPPRHGIRRRATAVPLSDILPQVLRQAHATRAAVQELQRHWECVVGKTLAKRTRPVSLRRGVLYVRTDEPGASYALSLEKPALLSALKAAGLEVEEIVVLAGELGG